MIFRAFDKEDPQRGKLKIYAVEIQEKEILETSFTEADQMFFESCRDGPISRQVLGISILLRKIEDYQALQQVKKDLKWKPTSSDTSDPSESGLS